LFFAAAKPFRAVAGRHRVCNRVYVPLISFKLLLGVDSRLLKRLINLIAFSKRREGAGGGGVRVVTILEDKGEQMEKLIISAALTASGVIAKQSPYI